jgi:hypothetical protein
VDRCSVLQTRAYDPAEVKVGPCRRRKICEVDERAAPNNMIPIRVVAALDHQLALEGWKRKIVLERGVGCYGTD